MGKCCNVKLEEQKERCWIDKRWVVEIDRCRCVDGPLKTREVGGDWWETGGRKVKIKTRKFLSFSPLTLPPQIMLHLIDFFSKLPFFPRGRNLKRSRRMWGTDFIPLGFWSGQSKRESFTMLLFCWKIERKWMTWESSIGYFQLDYWLI